MNILIVGLGEVGSYLAKVLSTEGHSITVIDPDRERIRRVADLLDVQTVHGDGSRPDVLDRAEAHSCDLLLAVANDDKVNMLTTLFGKRMGAKKTILRLHDTSAVRRSRTFFRKNLQYDLLLSLDDLAAGEIVKIVRQSKAIGVENFAEGKVTLTVDLEGDHGTKFIGYKARKNADLIDIDQTNHYDAADFWEPIYARADRAIILDPDDFHILASREAITVPPDHAAEMVAYDTLVGEFRVHYAGFFDPGFGYEVEGAPGTRAVLEVRSHEVPFVIEHGQTMGRLVYERLTGVPDKIYGAGIGSSYQHQGLTLSKHFRR